MAKKLGKRKIDLECRIFNLLWTNDYHFVQCKEKAVCLICQEAVGVFKEYKLHRHYESSHKDEYDRLQGQMRADKPSNTCVLQAQLNHSSVRASFRVAQLLASSGKPFTDGELVKCLNAVTEVLCPEKMSLREKL